MSPERCVQTFTEFTERSETPACPAVAETVAGGRRKPLRYVSRTESPHQREVIGILFRMLDDSLHLELSFAS